MASPTTCVSRIDAYLRRFAIIFLSWQSLSVSSWAAYVRMGEGAVLKRTERSGLILTCER